jgi:hypothetical protein
MDWIKKKKATIISRSPAAEKLAKCVPMVKTIQAEHGIMKIAQVANAAIHASQQFREFLPTMQIIAESFCDKVPFIAGFSGLAIAAGIAGNLVLTYQGVQALKKIAAHLKDISDSLAAQTALTAPETFARHVYQSVYQGINNNAHHVHHEHWFFVYHPDTDWYPAFHWKITEERLKKNFCGYSNQLDSVVIFMLAARTELAKEQKRAEKLGKPMRDVVFHLLIPAYRPLVITEPLAFPKELSPFVVEGEIHNSNELVWLNIPEEQEDLLFNVGNWKPPPPSILESIGTALGMTDVPLERGKPRVLGTVREVANIERDDSSISSNRCLESHSDNSDSGDVMLYRETSRQDRQTRPKTNNSQSSANPSPRKQSKTKSHDGSTGRSGSGKSKYVRRKQQKPQHSISSLPRRSR